MLATEHDFAQCIVRRTLIATILTAKNFVYVKNSINFAQSLIT